VFQLAYAHKSKVLVFLKYLQLFFIKFSKQTKITVPLKNSIKIKETNTENFQKNIGEYILKGRPYKRHPQSGGREFV